MRLFFSNILLTKIKKNNFWALPFRHWVELSWSGGVTFWLGAGSVRPVTPADDSGRPCSVSETSNSKHNSTSLLKITRCCHFYLRKKSWLFSRRLKNALDLSSFACLSCSVSSWHFDSDGGAETPSVLCGDVSSQDWYVCLHTADLSLCGCKSSYLSVCCV